MSRFADKPVRREPTRDDLLQAAAVNACVAAAADDLKRFSTPNTARTIRNLMKTEVESMVIAIISRWAQTRAEQRAEMQRLGILDAIGLPVPGVPFDDALPVSMQEGSDLLG